MTILFVLGGGIGNIVQATPAVKLAAENGHIVDLLLFCNSSTDMDIFKLPCVRNVYCNALPTDYEYDVILQGPFTPNLGSNTIKSRVNYDQHLPEAYVYYDLIKQIDIYDTLPDAEIAFDRNGPKPEHAETVAIYTGSKPSWSMKRWDKYDQLVGFYPHVTVIGKSEDIKSHGDPAWIKKAWNWPEHVKFFSGTLAEAACYISHCQFYIGNDGGLSHVAAATGIPTYVLFGPSSDIKNKPFSKNAKSIAVTLPCRPCQFQTGPDGTHIFGDGKSDCPQHMKCMKDMTVDFVLEQTNSKKESYDQCIDVCV